MSVAALGAIAARAAGALGGVLAARLLGPEDRGTYGLLVLAGTLGGLALTAGVHFWVSREVAQGRSAAEVRAVIARHLRGVVGCSVVACGLIVGLGGFDETAAALTTVFLAVGVTTGALYLAVPIGMQQMGRASIATGTGAAAYALVVCILLVIEVRSVPLVMLAAGASGWIAAGLVLDLVRRLPKTRAPSDGHRAALRLGLPAAGGEILVFAMLRIDLVLVALWLDPVHVGYYAVALSISEALLVLPDGAAYVLLGHVAADPVAAQTARMVRLVTAALLAAGAVLAAAAPVVVPWVFGVAFQDASAAVPGLVVASLGLAVWKMLGADLIARGHGVGRLISAFAGLTTMVACNVILIPRYGIVGASWGSAVGYVVAAAVLAVTWKRVTEGTVRSLVCLRRDDLAGALRSLRPGHDAAR